MDNNFYKQLMQEAPIGYAYHKIICDDNGIPCDYEFIEINNAFERLTGLKGLDIIGKKITEIPLTIAREIKNGWVKVYGDIAINGGSNEIEEFSETLQRWYKIKISSPEKYYFITHVIDVTNEMSQLTEMKNHLSTVQESELQYKALADYAYGWLTWEDAAGKLKYVSPACKIISGYSETQFLEDEFLFASIIIEEDKELWLNHRNKISAERGKHSTQFRVRNTDGKIVWIEHTCRPAVDKDGVNLGYRANNRDITERKRLETDLAQEKKLLEITLTSVGEGVISTDRKGNIVFLNRVAEFLSGWTQEAARGKSIEESFNIANDAEHGNNKHNIAERVLKSGKILELTNNTLLISKDGIERPIEGSAAPIIQENGEIVGIVLVFRDFSEKRQKEKEIFYLRYHDQLTGLYNRRFYEEQLRKYDTKRNLPMTIVMADVNGLKLINDSFGHVMGDELLTKVAEVITKACRTEDIIARLGGDEFVILLPKTSALETEQIIKRIKGLVSAEKVGTTIDISVSFGYETKTNGEEKIQEIVKNAEDQMYKNKLFESPSIRGKTIKAIINTLHEKNKREEQHSHRVSELCKSTGEALGLNEYENEELKSVGLLHDIGKIAIHENVLNKPGELTHDEWKEIKRHPEIGYRILNTVNDMSDMANYVLYHHERWDGKGYPKGSKGEQIPFVSRIIAIADAYDAMTSERSYRSALSDAIAIEELQKNAGIQFDPELVKLFIGKVLNKSLTKRTSNIALST